MTEARGGPCAIEPAGRHSLASRLGLAAVLLVALALRAWGLAQNGYDNDYYAAAVRSMAGSWHNFFYNSFDPAGFVSVDKPPAALWVQVASVALFGFQWWSVLLPQVLEGLLSVALVHHLVRRRFGTGAGLLAALFLALTPVSVAIDRSSNTDSCLVLVLLLAAWALTCAAETGSRAALLSCMALIGLGFNVKMLAAYVVVPTFVVAYWLGAPLAAWRRVLDLALAGLVLVAVSLPWTLLYDLTPVEQRPFAGSTQHNSMIELAIGHNGIGRFVRPERPALMNGARAIVPSGQLPGSPAWTRQFVRIPVGPLRLADGRLAAQASWLLPLAMAGILLGALGARAVRPLSPVHVAVVLWSGWALTSAVVYSAAGGIFHFYYLATMAPPLAALAAIGVALGWQRYRAGGWSSTILPAALLATGLWQAHVQSSGVGLALSRSRAAWTPFYLAPTVSMLLAAGLVLVGRGKSLAGRRPRGLAPAMLAVSVIALLGLPLAWSLSSVLVRGIPVLPAADLYRLSPEYGSVDARARFASQEQTLTRTLIEFLQANRHGERYLLATSSTRLAAPIIIETGQPVMARGGFHGLDQIVTPEQLARLVDAGQVRFAMLGDLSPVSRWMGGEAAGQPITDWVRDHGTLVDPSLWQPDTRLDRRLAARVGAMQLYDLRRATAPLVPASGG